MTDEELDAIAETSRAAFHLMPAVQPTIDALIAEVRRLRALVDAVRWVEDACPWCGGYPKRRLGDVKHFADCPAFPPKETR